MFGGKVGGFLELCAIACLPVNPDFVDGGARGWDLQLRYPGIRSNTRGRGRQDRSRTYLIVNWTGGGALLQF